jgi:hypothetical protein
VNFHRMSETGRNESTKSEVSISCIWNCFRRKNLNWSNITDSWYSKRLFLMNSTIVRIWNQSLLVVFRHFMQVIVANNHNRSNGPPFKSIFASSNFTIHRTRDVHMGNFTVPSFSHQILMCFHLNGQFWSNRSRRFQWTENWYPKFDRRNERGD